MSSFLYESCRGFWVAHCKSRVLHPVTGFLSSATWPCMLKEHCDGSINQSLNLSIQKGNMFKYEYS